MTESDASDVLRTKGLRQGILIEPVPGSALHASLELGEHGFVIASQDCDVVLSADQEPTVDVLPFACLESVPNDLRFGKNPRQFALECANGAFVQVDIRRRQTVMKPTLAEGLGAEQSFGVLSADERRRFARWLGRRYTRDAFPDTFNDRLKAKRVAFEKLVKSASSKPITSVLILLSPADEELADDEEYEVFLWCTCSEESHATPAIQQEAREFTDKYAALLKECDGISLLEAALKPHSQVTMDDLLIMRRFEYDHRSSSGKPGGESADP